MAEYIDRDALKKSIGESTEPFSVKEAVLWLKRYRIDREDSNAETQP